MRWRSEIDVFSRSRSPERIGGVGVSGRGFTTDSAPAPEPSSPPAPAADASPAAPAAAATVVNVDSGAVGSCGAAVPSGNAGVPRRKQAVQRFYDEQDVLITAIEDTEARIARREAGLATRHSTDEDARTSAAEAKHITFLINLSFVLNVCLFALKIFVAAYSGSLAIVASAVESSLDIFSGSIIWCAARIARRRNVHKWPIGKTRLEPLAIVIFASVMFVASLEIVISSIESIVAASGGSPPVLSINIVSYGSLLAVIVAKAALFVATRAMRNSASCAALAQDSLNDVITNSVALIAIVLIGQVPGLWWLDPGAAMGISFFIIVTWLVTGREHAIGLTGHAANKRQLAQMTYLAMNHDPRILAVDTVRAYYVGLKLVVELDIVLPPDMPLRTAHDIGEALQLDIERMDDVER